MSNQPAKPTGTTANKPTPSTATSTSAFAAAVLARGGEVHRVNDGAGGYFQIAILNPAALRNGNQGGRN